MMIQHLFMKHFIEYFIILNIDQNVKHVVKFQNLIIIINLENFVHRNVYRILKMLFRKNQKQENGK